MTDDSSLKQPADGAEGRQNQPAASNSVGRRMLLAARVVQVRLRFVVVLVIAFLVVGLWGNLRNYWDTMTHRFTGSHIGQHSVSEDTEYFCPMDPGVISDWPAICPVCNMDLVRRKKGEAVVLPEGLVARMQFSPYRIQLAGIKTSIVTRRPLVREIVLAGRLIESSTSVSPESPDLTPAAAGKPATNLVLVCEAYAGDQALLTPARRAEISVEGLPGAKPYSGSVVAVVASSGSASGRPVPTVQFAFDNSHGGLRPGMYCTARVAVPVAEIEPWAASLPASKKGATEGFVAVPETAVVDTGSRRVVFVETMPGMFDGVEVTLGPRCGDFYPVLAGLESGQKVAAVGAFLIDAEARLSPNLAAGYFGASRTAESEASNSPAPTAAPAKPLEKPRKKSAPARLSAADQQLVKKQKTCPVTDLPLDSMGGAVAVDVAGQRVFICCKGCESKLKQDPQKYLSKLKSK